MASDKEKKGFMNKVKNWAKIGVVAGMTTFAGMSQADALNNQPVIDNDTQTRISDMQQNDAGQQLQELCKQKLLIANQARTFLMQNRTMMMNPEYKSKIDEFRQRMEEIDNKIIAMQSVNPEINVPGLTISKDPNTQKASVRVVGTIRGNQVILGNSVPEQNKTQSYENQSRPMNTWTQRQVRDDGQER